MLRSSRARWSTPGPPLYCRWHSSANLFRLTRDTGSNTQSLERIPILSSALWLSQSVGVDREDSANSRQQMDLVASRLKGGRSIVVFPEGFRSTAPVLMPFKKGAVVTALEQQVDIVPITIVGTGSLYPPNQLMVMPGDVLVVIHPRESTAGLNLSDRARSTRGCSPRLTSAFL